MRTLSTAIYRDAFGRYPRYSHGCRRGIKTLLIPKEDPRRTWERRVPITPDGVKELLGDADVRVHVERCDRRIVSAEQWRAVSFLDRYDARLTATKAGATIVPSITDSNPDVILGIKEPTIASVNSLIDKDPSKERTWMVFSHTHKGQVSQHRLATDSQLTPAAALQHAATQNILARCQRPNCGGP